MTSVKLDEFAEDTKVNENVEIMRGPVPFKIDGATVGTCSVTREQVLDYKSKQPTGEKLVYLVVQPSQGRAQKIRLKHAVGALESLGFIGGEEPAQEKPKKA